MRKAVFLFCLVLFCSVPISQAQMNPLSGTWQGELQFAQGAPMRIIFLITETKAALTAKVHVSNEGAQFLPVDPIKRSGQTLDFEIKKLNGSFTGTIVGDHIKGTFKHGDSNIPLVLTRTARPVPNLGSVSGSISLPPKN